MQSLNNTSSLVLDIRGNTGGLISNVNYIASRFTSEQKDYAEVRTKNGPGRNDFTSPVTHTTTPAGTQYTRPIVLLTNKQTISAGEWFTLVLRSQSHVAHAGGTTCGAFSVSLERSLINGWLYSISAQKVTDMAGICYEGTGITPEYKISNRESELAADRDTQLEYAMNFSKR